MYHLLLSLMEAIQNYFHQQEHLMSKNKQGVMYPLTAIYKDNKQCNYLQSATRVWLKTIVILKIDIS